MDRTIQPKIEELSEIKLLPVERMVMPNGIPLSVINAEEQKVVRLDLLIGGGIWTQSSPLQAYFTNAMLREGTGKYSSSVIAEKFDFYGSTLELSLSWKYSFVTVYSLNKYFDQTLDLLADLVTGSIFPEDELQVLSQRELQKYRINNTRTKFITLIKLRAALYGSSHPMGKIAEEKDYVSVTVDKLHAYFDRHYNSANCHIMLSGKVTDHILRQTEKVLGTTPFGKIRQSAQFDSYPICPMSDKRLFIEKPDAKQSSIKLGMHTINQLSPDFHKFNVLVTILGGYFGSRLMSNIREDKGYTYGIYSAFLHQPDSSLLIIGTEAGNEYVEPLISEVYKEIDRLQNDLVGEEELSIVRSYMTGDLCRNMEQSFSAADAYQMQFISGLPDNFQTESLNAIRSVTPQELRSLAQRYLCKENLKEVISGKKNV